MRVKLLLALVLNLATIGLSLPALACGVEHRYYGNYYPYKMEGHYIYVGSKGDYFDHYGMYYPDDKHPEYKDYFNTKYKPKQFGNYFDEYGQYHDKHDKVIPHEKIITRCG